MGHIKRCWPARKKVGDVTLVSAQQMRTCALGKLGRKTTWSGCDNDVLCSEVAPERLAAPGAVGRNLQAKWIAKSNGQHAL